MGFATASFRILHKLSSLLAILQKGPYSLFRLSAGCRGPKPSMVSKQNSSYLFPLY